MARKRKVSAATLRALARGRRKLAESRKSGLCGVKRRKTKRRKARRTTRISGTSSAGPVVVITTKRRKGGTMAKKRRKSRKHVVRHYGFEGFKRKAKRRGHRRSVRFLGGSGKSAIVNTAKTGLFAIAGALAGAYLGNLVPLSPKIKAATPLAAGFGLSMIKFGKSAIGQGLSLGLIAIGGLSLIRQFAPTIPVLAGEDDYGAEISYNPEEQAMLGLSDDGTEMLGIEQSYGADVAVSSADM